MAQSAKISQIQDLFRRFRGKSLIIVVGILMVLFSVFVSGAIGRILRAKEQNEAKLWAMAIERVSRLDATDPIVSTIIGEGNRIPFIVTDNALRVEEANLVKLEVLQNPELLKQQIEKFSRENPPIEIVTRNGSRYYLFFGNSILLELLYLMPLMQIFLLVIFGILVYITLRSSKEYEQNKVWVGLAKETAHQLGTPTSSLLGWVEYLRGQSIDQTIADNMQNDIERLMKVINRFSKIGSETVLTPENVNEVVAETVNYFRLRIPKNVTLHYNGLSIAPIRAMVNVTLFEWVVENLLKNALDALSGKGDIFVNIKQVEEEIVLDVTDTGKGMAKAVTTKIFSPGFTTKSRGWGLGLSLSKRIISEYHKGKIWVVDSEINKGTTIRITLATI